MILYKTTHGLVVASGDHFHLVPQNDWDQLFNSDGLHALLHSLVVSTNPLQDFTLHDDLPPPIGLQEVWAAGVTYLRSKAARMEESQDAGGSNFYDRVYSANRPELFFKATPQRVVGHGAMMHLRSDSKWMVPEPELTLAINRAGKIIGYTVGNDLSCRDIEAENPLYLPQAKTFNASAALGPGIWITDQPIPPETEIRLEIVRERATVFRGTTDLRQMKRKLDELVEFLFRDNAFRDGCFLMTGTGVVPPDGFCLRAGDEMRITIPPIGTLVNTAT